MGERKTRNHAKWECKLTGRPFLFFRLWGSGSVVKRLRRVAGLSATGCASVFRFELGGTFPGR